MKAIILNEAGGTEKLVCTELPIPSIQDNDVLIQVKAISVNPVDIKTRSGKGIYGRLKDEKPLILGWDISGIVTETGKNAALFKKGDEVFGMINFPGHGKAYAEYVSVPETHLAMKPENITHQEAAASTLAALTAWQVLVTHAKIKSGDRVLIHGASGGVGHFAVQVAKHFGAYVIGTSSAKNKDFVLSSGADEHIDYQAQSFEKAVSNIDMVLDTIGGEYIERSLEVVRQGGTLISIPTGLSEAVTEKATAKGVNAYFILVQSNGNDMKHIADLLESGIIKVHIAAVYPFDEMAKAHQQLESGRTVGKVVIDANNTPLRQYSKK